MFLVIALPAEATQMSGEEREAYISKTLDCFASQKGSAPEVDWNEVCYTDADPEGFIRYGDMVSQGRNQHKAKTPAARTREYQSDPIYVSGPGSDSPTDITVHEPMDWETSSYGSSSTTDNWFYNLLDRDNPLNDLDFGFEVYQFRYREPNFMKEKGTLFGVFGVYTHRISENKHIRSFKDIFSDVNKFNLFRMDARFGFGDVDYESEGTGTLDDIPDYTVEARGVIGYDIPIGTSSRLTPYAGFGYRYLNDDSGGKRTTTGHFGYERESRYAYIPLGIEGNTRIMGSWIFQFTAEYDFFISGLQKSHLEDVVGGLNTVENDQDDGYGMRGSVKLMKQNENIDFFIEPFIRYWHVEDSQISALTFSNAIVGYGLEPENKSTEWGVRIGARY